MADYAVTASAITQRTDTLINGQYTCGETVAAGQAVYLDASAAPVIRKANAATSAATSKMLGIALNSATVGQPIDVATGGSINIAATPALVNRAVLVLSGAVAGNLAPSADLTTNIATWYATVALVATGATTAQIVAISTQV